MKSSYPSRTGPAFGCWAQGAPAAATAAASSIPCTSRIRSVVSGCTWQGGSTAGADWMQAGPEGEEGCRAGVSCPPARAGPCWECRLCIGVLVVSDYCANEAWQRHMQVPRCPARMRPGSLHGQRQWHGKPHAACVALNKQNAGSQRHRHGEAHADGMRCPNTTPRRQECTCLAVAAQAPRVLPPPLMEDEHLAVKELLLQAGSRQKKGRMQPVQQRCCRPLASRVPPWQGWGTPAGSNKWRAEPDRERQQIRRGVSRLHCAHECKRQLVCTTRVTPQQTRSSPAASASLLAPPLLRSLLPRGRMAVR